MVAIENSESMVNWGSVLEIRESLGRPKNYGKLGNIHQINPACKSPQIINRSVIHDEAIRTVPFIELAKEVTTWGVEGWKI